MGAGLNDVNEIFAAEVHVRQLYKKREERGGEVLIEARGLPFFLAFLAFLPLPHLRLHRG